MTVTPEEGKKGGAKSLSISLYERERGKEKRGWRFS